MVSALLITLGGGLVGAVLGILIANYFDLSTMDDVKALLSATLTSSLLSVDSELEQLRRPVYRYYATTVEGRYVWRAWIYHFEHSVGVGTLTTRVQNRDEFGVTRRYRVEAGVRGTRIIMFGIRLNGPEAVSVSVYPGVLGAFRQYHCGLSFLHNFDSEEIVTRTIISFEALVEGTIGVLTSEESDVLDGLWEKQFPRSIGTLIEGPKSVRKADSAQTVE
jgi:hypothetical protein